MPRASLRRVRVSIEVSTSLNVFFVAEISECLSREFSLNGERISTVDLLVPTSSDQLLLMLRKVFLFFSKNMLS
jgi:hypothetical protein